MESTADRCHPAGHNSQCREKLFHTEEGENLAEEPYGRNTSQRTGDDGHAPGAHPITRNDPAPLHAPEKTPHPLKGEFNIGDWRRRWMLIRRNFFKAFRLRPVMFTAEWVRSLVFITYFIIKFSRRGRYLFVDTERVPTLQLRQGLWAQTESGLCTQFLL